MLDGEEEPIDRGGVVDHHYPRHRRHHVHHRPAVAVKVFYQGGDREHDFRRQAPLERVLDWAIKAFQIDPAMAGEFELTKVGGTEELPLTEHVGHVAGNEHKLELNLVRGDICHGASHD